MYTVGRHFMPMSGKIDVPFWHPSRQYLAHKQEFDAAIERVLTNGDLILRDEVDRFEDDLAKFLGVRHVVSVASGTDAMILSLKASNIGLMDEVICPSYTFRATLEAIYHVGAKPVLYDLDGRYEHLITKKTAAILPAHLEGYVREDMPQMSWFCQRNGITLIEDSCQALSAAPLSGIAAAYSFYPAKILGCFGDGGAIATNNDDFAKHLKKLRNHYKGDWGYGYGFNSRLDNLQAAILLVKMKYLPESIYRRKQIAMRYDRELVGVGLPKERMVYQDYIIVCRDFDHRDKLLKHLNENGIGATPNEYPFPGDIQKGLGAQAYEMCSIRLPATTEHTEEEVGAVIAAVNSYGG